MRIYLLKLFFYPILFNILIILISQNKVNSSSEKLLKMPSNMAASHLADNISSSSNSDAISLSVCFGRTQHTQINNYFKAGELVEFPSSLQALIQVDKNLKKQW
jgi:hypothetical protein